MKKLVLATNNQHKVQEIKQILEDMPLEVASLKDMGIDIEVEEDGESFLENSYKKAKAIYDILKFKDEKFIVMADDSGLMVDALGGAPGVYSARYSGEHGNSQKNNEKLLKELQGTPFEERKGRFVCAVVLINDDGDSIKVEEYAEGYIGEKLEGLEGFGYDPLFYVPEFHKTFAEMSSKEKNSISHRGKALEKVKKEIVKFL